MKKAIIFSFLAAGICLVGAILLIWYYQVTMESIMGPMTLTEVVKDETLELTGQQKLKLELCGAKVELRESNSLAEQIEVHENSKYFRPQDLETKLIQGFGQEVTISNCHIYNSQGGAMFGTPEQEVSLVIVLPQGKKWQEIEIESNYQTQIAGKLVAVTEIAVESSVGWTNLEQLSMEADQIKIESGTGRLDVAGLKAREIWVENVMGYVRVMKSTGQVMVENVAGEVELEDCELATGSKVIDNVAGEIKVVGGKGVLEGQGNLEVRSYGNEIVKTERIVNTEAVSERLREMAREE